MLQACCWPTRLWDFGFYSVYRWLFTQKSSDAIGHFVPCHPSSLHAGAWQLRSSDHVVGAFPLRMNGAGSVQEDSVAAMLRSLDVPDLIARQAAQLYPDDFNAALDWACSPERRHVHHAHHSLEPIIIADGPGSNALAFPSGAAILPSWERLACTSAISAESSSACFWFCGLLWCLRCPSSIWCSLFCCKPLI